jgi:hypothetical protein
MRICKFCRTEFGEAHHDLNICSRCWEKTIQNISLTEYPCANQACLFVCEGGVELGGGGGCSCLSDFPMAEDIQKALRQELRLSVMRATKNGRRQAIRWFEKAIEDKLWKSEDAGDTILKQLEYILERMKMEL